MRILVPVKTVVDYNMRVHVKADGSEVDLENVKLSMNPFDEIALEEAVRLKEAGLAEEVMAVSCGPRQCRATLRLAMAMGADRVLHVVAPEGLRPLAVARVLEAVCKREAPGLVMCGKQAVGEDSGQTGQMLAALLDWPQACFASKLTFSEGEAQVSREVDGGTQTLAVQLPAVITTDLRLNQPRYATLPNIMKARQQPISEMTMQSLGVDPASSLALCGVSEPPQQRAGQHVADSRELVAVLRNEARVI